MKSAWENQTPELLTLEGRGRGVEYRLSYPRTGDGFSDRRWREAVFALRDGLLRERYARPCRVTGEWQETRRDGLAFSGFLDVYRASGYADVGMRRIAMTFLPGGRRPTALGELLVPGGAGKLRPLLRLRARELKEREESFFLPDFSARPESYLHPRRFYLTGEGLALFFPQERVAPRAAGIPTLFFPYEEIKDALRYPFYH